MQKKDVLSRLTEINQSDKFQKRNYLLTSMKTEQQVLSTAANTRPTLIRDGHDSHSAINMFSIMPYN